jgi:hypothetical protein
LNLQPQESLCAEEKLQKSLIDSERQTDREDTSCAKCQSKDLPADNDVTFCDDVFVRCVWNLLFSRNKFLLEVFCEV